MNKENFIEMINNAKEDENGHLYVLGEYNNRIYFGTITTTYTLRNKIEKYWNGDR